MALIKSETKPAGEREQRRQPRDLPGLLGQMQNDDGAIRRWAARDLAAYPQAVEPLCRHLLGEADPSVREAVFDTLLKIGGDKVVEHLLPLLRSDDAALRNGVIEVLQELPEEISPHMERLLQDPDSDVRIFAIDILQVLAHPDIPKWLVQILAEEEHLNVLATAIDRISEVGTPEMVPALRALKDRFPDQPYIAFAVDTAVRRIGAE